MKNIQGINILQHFGTNAYFIRSDYYRQFMKDNGLRIYWGIWQIADVNLPSGFADIATMSYSSPYTFDTVSTQFISASPTWLDIWKAADILANNKRETLAPHSIVGLRQEDKNLNVIFQPN